MKKYCLFLSKICLAIVVTMLFVIAVGCEPEEEVEPAEEVEPEEEVAPEEEEAWSLSAGHVAARTHPMQLALEEFADNVYDRTDGRVKVETHPEAELGGEREIGEGVSMGTIDIGVITTAVTALFVEEMALFDLPFLFEEREEAYAFLDGETGDELMGKVTEREGMVGLGYMENGFRHLTNSILPVRTPEDVEGLSIRTMENEMHMDAWRTLGADPTPMGWHEVPTALQQGVVDGQENPLAIIATDRIYEFQEYISLTHHNYSPFVIMINEERWNEFPEDIKEIIEEEAWEATLYQRELMIEGDEEYLEEISQNVEEVVEDVDIEAFRDAVEPVYEKYMDEIGRELVEEIIELD